MWIIRAPTELRTWSLTRVSMKVSQWEYDYIFQHIQLEHTNQFVAFVEHKNYISSATLKSLMILSLSLTVHRWDQNTRIGVASHPLQHGSVKMHAPQSFSFWSRIFVTINCSYSHIFWKCLNLTVFFMNNQFN